MTGFYYVKNVANYKELEQNTLDAFIYLKNLTNSYII